LVAADYEEVTNSTQLRRASGRDSGKGDIPQCVELVDKKRAIMKVESFLIGLEL
jgi:hypothetical protein